MTSRALVLGGGGPVGIGWEAGMLKGLADEDIQLPEADLIVGTSAGSGAGAAGAGSDAGSGAESAGTGSGAESAGAEAEAAVSSGSGSAPTRASISS